MKLRTFVLGMAGAGALVAIVTASELASSPADWHMNASIIEACSCPMFCQCYFNPAPAAHGEGGHEGHGGGAGHFCRFNNAFRVNRGFYGETSLDGALFWVAGDLGSEFDDGEMDWAVLTFDPSVSAAQREGITTVLGHLYPVKWKSFEIAADAAMEWRATAERAEARLDGGRAAEVVLNAHAGMGGEPVVIQNLVYWGAPRHDGFVMMPNEVEAYRLGEKAFEYRGSNGFMITFDIADEDVAAVEESVAAVSAGR